MCCSELLHFIVSSPVITLVGVVLFYMLLPCLGLGKLAREQQSLCGCCGEIKLLIGNQQGSTTRPDVCGPIKNVSFCLSSCWLFLSVGQLLKLFHAVSNNLEC